MNTLERAPYLLNNHKKVCNQYMLSHAISSM